MKDITDTVNDVCIVRQWMGYNYVRAVGYCLYGTLLLRLSWTACPVQIRAHHHIAVCVDINKSLHHLVQIGAKTAGNSCSLMWNGTYSVLNSNVQGGMQHLFDVCSVARYTQAAHRIIFPQN